MTDTTERAELLARFSMVHDLIQEAKGFEGERGGPITDHLDSAEVILDEIEEELTALSAAPRDREAPENEVERVARAMAVTIAKRHGHDESGDGWMNEQRREEARAAIAALSPVSVQHEENT